MEGDLAFHWDFGIAHSLEFERLAWPLRVSFVGLKEVGRDNGDVGSGVGYGDAGVSVDLSQYSQMAA